MSPNGIPLFTLKIDPGIVPPEVHLYDNSIKRQTPLNERDEYRAVLLSLIYCQIWNMCEHLKQ